MRETKEQRNARMLEYLSGNHVSGQVVWNMARELKATNILLSFNGMLVQPQRQDLMWNLKNSPESVWYVIGTSSYTTMILTQPTTADEEVEPGFATWSQCVAGAKPTKVETKTADELREMAEEMLDDMIVDDMMAWAASRDIAFDADSGRTEMTVDIVENVGLEGWAEHFGVVLA